MNGYPPKAVCPKCKSTEVHTHKGDQARGLSTLECSDCGYKAPSSNSGWIPEDEWDD
jgi:hypothetical protein